MTIRSLLNTLLSAKQASSSVPQSQEERDAARLAQAKAWIAARETPKRAAEKNVKQLDSTSPDSYISDPKFFHLPGNIHNTHDR